MTDDTKTKKKRGGLLSAIWESMTKTGGCCGPGESCCGPASESPPLAPGKDSAPPDEVQEEN